MTTPNFKIERSENGDIRFFLTATADDALHIGLHSVSGSSFADRFALFLEYLFEQEPGWTDVTPSSIGALTDAPLLCYNDDPYNPTGTMWKDERYQIEDGLDEMCEGRGWWFRAHP